MPTIIMGIFLILHGLVHLLYAGQSRRLFELRPNMTWPNGAWAFSRFPGNKVTQLLVSILLALATLGFVASGLGLLIGQDWWPTIVASSAVLSTAIFILSWNGKFEALDNQGGVGMLINLAIMVAVLLLKWPS
ncbi:MAG: hypothetical protein JXB07_10515 [Anaerolineae bacterium]|nr:hypothetical protein [Anaerolineae bacterium]